MLCSRRLVGASRDGDYVVIDLPARQLTSLAEPLGCERFSAANRAGQCDESWVAVLPDVGAVRGLTPDLAAVAKLPITSLLVTASGEPGAEYNFVSRYFRPIDGIPEDPVTGSAHCLLERTVFSAHTGARFSASPIFSPLSRRSVVAASSSRFGGAVSSLPAAHSRSFGENFSPEWLLRRGWPRETSDHSLAFRQVVAVAG